MPGYSKQTWVDFVTSADAAHMNHLETGIYNADPGFYSARAYGAVGDGVTDDRAAIQAALDGSGVGVATSPIYLRVRAGGTITFTYTVAPSWSWFLEN